MYVVSRLIISSYFAWKSSLSKVIQNEIAGRVSSCKIRKVCNFISRDLFLQRICREILFDTVEFLLFKICTYFPSISWECIYFHSLITKAALFSFREELYLLANTLHFLKGDCSKTIEIHGLPLKSALSVSIRENLVRIKGRMDEH